MSEVPLQSPDTHRRGAPANTNEPASGENISHLCRLRILGYFGLDPLKGTDRFLRTSMGRLGQDKPAFGWELEPFWPLRLYRA